VLAQEELMPCLARLGPAGVEACRFRDLAQVLKRRVRAAHEARHRPPDDDVLKERRPGRESPTLIRITRPDSGYQEGEQYDRLVQAVRDEIARLPQERTRRGVGRLFDEVVRCGAAAEEVPPLDELARLLGMKRSTLHDYHKRLREICDRLTGPPGGA
jgi:hypothetical protein